MIDSTQPHDVFSGKDDVYRLLREARAAINLLSDRIDILERDMANTSGNSGMRPTVHGRKGGKNR